MVVEMPVIHTAGTKPHQLDGRNRVSHLPCQLFCDIVLPVFILERTYVLVQASHLAVYAHESTEVTLLALVPG